VDSWEGKTLPQERSSVSVIVNPNSSDAARQRPSSIEARQAVSGTFWTYLSLVVSKGLIFISTIVLARLLLPEDLGVMAYCLTAIQYLLIFQTFGVDAALISRQDKLDVAANIAFVLNLAIGTLLFGLAWALAPGIAEFFREPAMLDPFRVLILTLPLGALGAVPRTMLHRALRFRDRLFVEVGQSVIKATLSIVLVWQGYGIWSLVLGHLGGEAAATTLAWLLAGWRPSRAFERQVARELLEFGGHIVVVGIVGALLSNVDYLLIGRLLGAEALGFYTIGYRIPELVILNISLVIGTVSYPLFARAQADIGQLRSLFLSFMRYGALAIFPVSIGLMVTAPILIQVLFSERWTPAVFPMQCVALALAISSVGHLPGVVYKAINRPAILNQLALVKLPITVGLLWYATAWGIEGVAVAQIGVAIVRMLIDSVVVSRLLAVPLVDVIRTLAPAAMAAGAMGAIVAVTIAPVGQLSLLGLATAVVVGTAAYGAILWVVDRTTVIQASLVLRAFFARL
jgi:PST family polysaccharide transporter